MKNKNKYAATSVLVIDDDIDFVTIAVGHLNRFGFKKVKSATNGVEGIELARRIKPDLVLLDIEMAPGMDGFEVLEKFHFYKLDFKVILITAHDTGLVGMRGARLGITDFISKTNFSDSMIIKINPTTRHIK